MRVPPSVRIRGGRAAARGAQARIKASKMQDRIINNMDKKNNLRMTTEQFIDAITQANIAYHNFPESVAAKNRLEQLLKAYKKCVLEGEYHETSSI